MVDDDDVSDKSFESEQSLLRFVGDVHTRLGRGVVMSSEQFFGADVAVDDVSM